MSLTITILIVVVISILITTTRKKRKIQTILNNMEEKPVIIDVRTKQEFAEGHYDGARNIPHDQIEKRINELAAWKSSPIVVYCRAGSRAGVAEQILKAHGFTKVMNAGGYEAMKQYASGNRLLK
jgi:phage shock protein E